MLGVPVDISRADTVRVTFRDIGRGRSRLLHTGTRNGGPNEPWCEVSAMNNAALADPTNALDHLGVCGMLVDVVDGDP
jgi:hypothetical protein